MGMSAKPEDFELCTRVENVVLPKEGHFGVSAATGGLAGEVHVWKIKDLRQRFILISNSLIIHEAKTKENHKHDGFENVIKHLHKLAKLSPLFFPEVRICLRSCIKHSHQCLIMFPNTSNFC